MTGLISFALVGDMRDKVVDAESLKKCGGIRIDVNADVISGTFLPTVL